MRLTRRILDYQLRSEDTLRERMDEVMGGKVLPLPSDELREERAKGIEQGIKQGIEQGVRQGICALIEACQELGSSRSDTQTRLTTKFDIQPEMAEAYMKKYWKETVETL